MSASRLRTCAWIETSSAATDSSRISTRGSAASARAIATRWRWPPDSARGSARDLALVEADQVGQLARRAPRRSSRRAAAVQPQHLVDRLLGASGAGRGWSTGPGRRSAPRGRAGGARAPTRAGRGAVAAAGGDRARRSARSRPTIIRATVVLPEPDSPTMASEPPAGDARTTTSSTATSVAELLAQARDLEDRRQARRSAMGRLQAAGRAAPRRAGSAPRRRRAARSGGRAARQRSCACGQRGANAQPSRRLERRQRPAGDRRAAGRAVGVDVAAGRRPARRCRGAAGRRAAARDALRLDDLPGVHHRGAVADRARRAPGRG